MSDTLTRLAVLIDGDNMPPDLVAKSLREAEKIGQLRIKRAYRDWANAGECWQTLLSREAVRPIQQFGCLGRKNASDIAMVIDAMDLLYRGVKVFCLMSSDSDFTPLAVRLRQGGAKVFVCGEIKTPQALRLACDRFILVERDAAEPATPTLAKPAMDFEALALQAFAAKPVYATEGLTLSAFGVALREHCPGFDARKFGQPTLKKLVTASRLMDIHPDATQAPRVVLTRAGRSAYDVSSPR